jgi:anaerobic selenocysteine-containing dehydrogenase
VVDATMTHTIRLTVNGNVQELSVEPWQTLMDVLVEHFRVARTKEGCGIGECGSCTVAMNGKFVNACLVLAADASGRTIVTMEQLAGAPGFQPVMEAFIHPDPGAMRVSYAAPGTAPSTGVFTFCHLCPGHCSIKAIVEDNRVVDFEPDMESGLYAEQCVEKKGRFTIPEVLGHKDRLLHPLKRAGAKGEGKWERISWDQALDTIAAKFNEHKEKFGPESVAFGLGEPKGMEFAYAQRLASAFGTPSVSTPGWFCGVPKSMAGAYTYGGGTVIDDDNTPALLVIWGANVVRTTGGVRRETIEKVIEAGGKLIVVDPQRTDLATLADLWIRIRPGSDGALVAGVLKVIIEEELYDRDIVDNWTIGFERLREELFHVSLDEVERLTWVPRRQIESFARLYTQTKPAAMQTGNAVDQHLNSFQTSRAITTMRAISGNLNVPGGDVFLTPPSSTRPGNFYLLSKYRRNADKLLKGKFKFAQKTTSIPSHVLTKTILTGDPYPIKSAMFILTNPLVSYPNSKETYRALMALDFMVVSELFMTPTASLADIVLPVAWGMEHDELGYWPGWYEEVRAHPKLVDPPGECWPDTKIINELAKRLGVGADFWEDDNEGLEVMLKPSGLSFDEFKKQRVLQPTKEYRPNSYRTPSGKIEIYSEQLARMGYEPLPLWQELSRRVEPTAEYPLLMTNAKEETYMATAFKHVASIRLIRPEPYVELHPNTARELGLEEGTQVYIETEIGRAKQRLSLNRAIDPRIVVAAFGWWFPERAESGYGWMESNINMLTGSGPDYDPSTGGVAMRGIPCRVYAA